MECGDASRRFALRQRKLPRGPGAEARRLRDQKRQLAAAALLNELLVRGNHERVPPLLQCDDHVLEDAE